MERRGRWVSLLDTTQTGGGGGSDRVAETKEVAPDKNKFYLSEEIKNSEAMRGFEKGGGAQGHNEPRDCGALGFFKKELRGVRMRHHQKSQVPSLLGGGGGRGQSES